MTEFGCPEGHWFSASQAVLVAGGVICPYCAKFVTRADGLTNGEMTSADDPEDEEATEQ